MPGFSLKTKATVFLPLGLAFGLAVLLFLTHNFLHNYIRSSISSQQYQVLSILAESIDSSISERHSTLIAIAAKMAPQSVENPGQALAFLKQQSEHLATFDNGMFLFDRKGAMVAELPLGLQRAGKDFSYRDYLKKTIATRKPFISDPYESSQQHHHAALMFTAPVYNAAGEHIATLGGSIDLSRTSFVERLSKIQLVKGGYFYLIDQDRVLISHPDKSRIMKQDTPPGKNRLLDRAIAGFDGTDDTITSRGLHTLTSFQHLKTKNWIIAANYPVTEAYAPIHRLNAIFAVILPVLSLLLFWFMRRNLDRLTAPIIQLTGHVERLSDKVGDDRLFPVRGDNEIATLGNAFNELVLETDRQRLKLEADLERHERADAQLQRQNEYLQALHDTTLGLLSRHEMSGLLQTIVSRAGKLIGTSHCFVYLVDRDGAAMDMVIQSGVYDSLRHYPITLGQGIAGRVWATGRSVHVDDYCSWEGRLPDPERDVLHAMAGVPLRVAGEVIGVLGLAFTDMDSKFSQEQMEILEQFGELASLALENAHLVEESRRELTERWNAEERLRKLSVAVEQNPASIIITDINGTIEYVNPHFTSLTGYTPEEAVGQTPRILKSGETTPEEYRQLWQTIQSGGEWRGEFHNRKKDGDLYWEQAHISPIRDNSYSITHFIAIKEDITERKKLENQLRHSQKMEAVGQLAGGIAHDFNNILTAIIGYSSIIQFKLPEDSPLKRSAGQIIETAERGAALTQGLLAFSRKQASNPVVIDLNEIMKRVQQLLHRLISEDICLEIRLGPGSLPVLADSGQIEQVLMNLATNARDALPNGGTITVSTESMTLDSDFVLNKGFGETGNYALLSFSDNGEGMEESVSKHIFEPFYTTKDLGKGTGLGLSIVYGIIKKHNGYILCESACGVGTVFRIYLPLLAQAPKGAADARQHSAHENKGNNVILVAEDNEIARDLAKEILEEFGYSVIVAADGEQALELFKANYDIIDLVLLDVIMPRLNGREVYEAIRGIVPGVKAMFYSGYSEDAVISQGRLERGMNYLAKPFSPKELLMKVREVLDNGS